MKTSFFQVPIIFLVGLLLSLNTYGQKQTLVKRSDTKNIWILGQCMDTTSDIMDEKLVISVFDSSGKKNIRNFITNVDGSFLIELPFFTKFKLNFSATNFQNIDTIIFWHGTDTLNLGLIYLEPKLKVLTPVVVASRKKLVELSFNKIIYNPAADPLNAAINTFSMLQKVPLIDIGNNDNIHVANSSAFIILINGKEKAIISQNPSAYLKTLPASLVKSVEISTSPPAQYSSEGIKYVINIIAKEKLLDGIYANIGGGVSSKQQQANGFVLLKKNKLGVQINSYYNRLVFNEMSSTYHLRIKNDFSSDQRSSYKSISNVYSPGIGITYEVDTTFLLNADLYGTMGKMSNKNTTEVNNNSLSHQERIDRKTDYTADNGFIYYSFNAEKDLNPKKDKLAFSYQSYYSPGNRMLDGQVVDQSGKMISSYFNKGKARLNEHTLQAEYVKHFTTNQMLSTGIKRIQRKINSSNHFNGVSDTSSRYDQKIISLYSDYSLTLKKYQFKLGFNLSKSVYENYAGSGIRNLSRDYLNFFPNITISKQLPKNQYLSLRLYDYIKRPGLEQTSLAANVRNPESKQLGNFLVRPQIVYSSSLEYSKLIGYEPLMIGIFVNHSNDEIMAHRSVLNDSVLLNSYANLGKMFEIGNTFSYRFSIVKNMKLGINTTLSYLKISNKMRQNEQQTILNYSLSAAFTYKMPGNILFAFRNYFYAKVITYQGYSSGYWDARMSVSRHFLKNKLNLQAIVYNPFLKNQVVNNDYSGNYFSEFSTIITPQRYIGVNINFEFGNYMKSNFKRKTIKIKNTDLK